MAPEQCGTPTLPTRQTFCPQNPTRRDLQQMGALFILRRGADNPWYPGARVRPEAGISPAHAKPGCAQLPPRVAVSSGWRERRDVPVRLLWPIQAFHSDEPADLVKPDPWSWMSITHTWLILPLQSMHTIMSHLSIELAVGFSHRHKLCSYYIHWPLILTI